MYHVRRWRLDPQQIEDAIQPKTRLIVLTHASNVCGTMLPIRLAGEIAPAIKFICWWMPPKQQEYFPSTWNRIPLISWHSPVINPCTVLLEPEGLSWNPGGS